jgi:hypothetical protein
MTRLARQRFARVARFTGSPWAQRVAVVTLGCVVGTASLAAVAGPAVAASTWQVVTPANGGSDAHPCTVASPCATLARAVSVSAAGDTIRIGPGTFPTNIDLSSGRTIIGAGMNATFLDGGGTSTVMHCCGSSADTTITDLTVQHGNGTGLLRDPGGIFVGSGGLVARRIAVVSNVGTGIHHDGGGLTLTGSTVAGNTVGLVNFENGSTVSGSTFTDNGVGIKDEGCCSTFTNITVTENTGDGFDASNTSRALVSAATITGNGGFGLVQSSFMAAGPPSFGSTVRGSILSNNASGNCSISNDPSATFTDNGYNLEDDAGASCRFSATKHDRVGVDPQLDPVADNGGPTQTQRPISGSPAIDAIPNPTSGLCPGTDQRQVARPQGSGCDIGAVETATNTYVATPANGGNDANPCTQPKPCASLQAALQRVAANGTVHIGAGTFDTSTNPVIDQDVSVVGSGAGTTVLDGGATSGPIGRGSQVSVSISDLTIQHGSVFVADGAGLTLTRTTVENVTDVRVIGGLLVNNSTIDNYGEVCNCGAGAIQLSHSVVENGDGILGRGDQCGCVTVTDSVIRSNTIGIDTDFPGVHIVRSQLLDNGVGLGVAGPPNVPIFLDGSIVSGNGVGINAPGGALNIVNSSISDNTGNGMSFTGPGLATISDSTLARNHGKAIIAAGSAGSPWGSGGSLAIANSTIADNAGGGVIVQDTLNSIVISQSTIAGNAGPGFDTSALALPQPGLSYSPSLSGSIVAKNTGGNCLTGGNPNDDAGYNIEDDSGRSCSFSPASHSLVGVDPQLGVLAANGGPTQTMLPGPASPAINRIPKPTSATNADGTAATLCPGTDQRGVVRPQGPTCDIGAVEVANVSPVVTASPPDQTVTAGSGVSLSAAASGVPTPAVQWQVSTNGGTTFTNVAGAKSRTLAFTAASGQNGSRYRAVFTNAAGTATTAAATVHVCPCSVWPSGTPAAAAASDSTASELGVKFKTDVDGYVSGVRFYKGTTNTGTHIGNLWSGTGTLLARATFTGEHASGWQTVTFASRVHVTAGTTYVASYHTNVGHYADTDNAFTAQVNNPPLHALASGASGGNGVFAHSAASTFPTTSNGKATNYWVDVSFVPVTKTNQTISFPGVASATLAQSPVTISATASSGVTVTFSSTTPAVCTSGGTNGKSVTLLAVGTCTVQADQAGNSTYNPAPSVRQTFTVRAGVTIDQTVHQDGTGTQTTAPFSTAVPGEVLVAFVGSDGTAQTVNVSGAGLSWSLVKRTNARPGDAEIWEAVAPAALTNVTVTSKQSVGTTYDQSLTVVAFRGASGVGASASANAASGAPTVSLTTTKAGSWVFAEGDDWSNATARTVPAGQTMVHQWVDTGGGDTYWTQSTTAPTASSGTPVTIRDTAPTTDLWNFTAVEMQST